MFIEHGNISIDIFRSIRLNRVLLRFKTRRPILFLVITGIGIVHVFHRFLKGNAIDFFEEGIVFLQFLNRFNRLIFIEKFALPIILKELSVLHHFIHPIPVNIFLFLFSCKIVVDKTGTAHCLMDESDLVFVRIDTKTKHFFYFHGPFPPPVYYIRRRTAKERLFCLFTSNYCSKAISCRQAIHLPLIASIKAFKRLKRESSRLF